MALHLGPAGCEQEPFENQEINEQQLRSNRVLANHSGQEMNSNLPFFRRRLGRDEPEVAPSVRVTSHFKSSHVRIGKALIFVEVKIKTHGGSLCNSLYFVVCLQIPQIKRSK